VFPIFDYEKILYDALLLNNKKMEERKHVGIPNLTFEALSGYDNNKRPWCKCAGILMQRMLVQGDSWYCEICDRTEPIKKGMM
jgi:hypothetical protein